MSVIKSIAAAFSMFSRLPAPRVEWSKAGMRYMMAAFPLVGCVTGALTLLWAGLVPFLNAGPVLSGAGLLLLPVLVTGGIHLDGFCDTVDALSSHADREKRLKILEDPNIGAFAAIWLGAYLIAYWALASELELTSRSFYCYPLLFILSRGLSGLAVVLLPCAKDSGLARTFADAASKKACGAVLIVFIILSAAGMLFAGFASGAACIACCSLTFIFYARDSKRKFGGISGDLAGWFLQLAELFGLAGIVLGQKAVLLLA